MKLLSFLFDNEMATYKRYDKAPIDTDDIYLIRLALSAAWNTSC